MAKLSHPNVVQVYDAGTEEARLELLRAAPRPPTSVEGVCGAERSCGGEASCGATG